MDKNVVVTIIKHIKLYKGIDINPNPDIKLITFFSFLTNDISNFNQRVFFLLFNSTPSHHSVYTFLNALILVNQIFVLLSQNVE